MIDGSSSEETKEILTDAIGILEDNVEYADALCERVQGVQIAKDKAEERVSAPITAVSGIVLRAYKLGQWREASTYSFSGTTVRELARKISQFQPMSKTAVKLRELEPWKLDATLAVKIMPSEVETEEKLEQVRRLYNSAMSCDKRIINTTIGYVDETSEKIFANTEGSMLRQVIPRTSLFLMPVARDAGKIDYDYLSIGGNAGFEIVKDLEEKIIKETVDSSVSLLNASAPPSGHFTVVLDPGMTGTFAHESFGHGCEADQIVRKRSYLVPYF
jgi:TldD protein